MKTLDNPIRLKLIPLTIEDGEIKRINFMLVYQAGIANLFKVDCFNLNKFGRNSQRLFQGDFRTAEYMAHGAGLAGACVSTAACNIVGDIRDAKWTDDLESQPFSDQFHPVFYTVGI